MSTASSVGSSTTTAVPHGIRPEAQVMVEDRAIGVILGGMCGDILGAPVEGKHMTAFQVEQTWGKSGG
jgi:hypothetical protein